mmetsp:Transcript_50177/g.130651  ORF Transcript_50177/g.130651 Transcript_50177/m.130651 type:complete len:253 (-) Transcript_50177:18-776(-)
MVSTAAPSESRYSALSFRPIDSAIMSGVSLDRRLAFFSTAFVCAPASLSNSTTCFGERKAATCMAVWPCALISSRCSAKAPVSRSAFIIHAFPVQAAQCSKEFPVFGFFSSSCTVRVPSACFCSSKISTHRSTASPYSMPRSIGLLPLSSGTSTSAPLEMRMLRILTLSGVKLIARWTAVWPVSSARFTPSACSSRMNCLTPGVLPSSMRAMSRSIFCSSSASCSDSVTLPLLFVLTPVAIVMDVISVSGSQ